MVLPGAPDDEWMRRLLRQQEEFDRLLKPLHELKRMLVLQHPLQRTLPSYLVDAIEMRRQFEQKLGADIQLALPDSLQFHLQVEDAQRALADLTEPTQRLQANAAALAEQLSALPEPTLGCIQEALEFQTSIEQARQALERDHLAFGQPSAVELDALLGRGSASDIASLVSPSSPDYLAAALHNLQEPWARLANEGVSVRAFTELQSIGFAFQHVQTYEDSLTAALRVDLGDWRERSVIPDIELLDVTARTRIYRERGLDASLTDFPESVFSRGLSDAGLSDDYVADPHLESLLPAEADPVAAAAMRRVLHCQRLLHRVERELRTFINDVMTRHHGPNWPKKRLPPKVYARWQENYEASRKSGRPHAALIDGADFTDYEGIICRRDDFEALFQPVFGRPESVRETFHRLYPVRLNVAHARFVTVDDVLYTTAETTRLLRAIGIVRTT